jgi:hypothetical protein
MQRNADADRIDQSRALGGGEARFRTTRSTTARRSRRTVALSRVQTLPGAAAAVPPAALGEPGRLA